MDTIDPRPGVDDDAPEWASRFITIPEIALITGTDCSTVHRRISAGIYPGKVHFAGSSRVVGWEFWKVCKERMAARDNPGTAR